VHLGYAISETFTLGIHISYNKQLLALKGKIIDEFNPNSINSGLFALIFIK
jgi:hypothetical protein